MKLSQSNFNLWSPDSYSARSYLIAPVKLHNRTDTNTYEYADEWTNFLILQQDTSNVCGSLALMSLILYIL